MPLALSDLLPLLALGVAAPVCALDVARHAWVGDAVAALCIGAAFTATFLSRDLPALAPVAAGARVLVLLLYASHFMLVAQGYTSGERAGERPDPHLRRRLTSVVLVVGAILLGHAIAPTGPILPLEVSR